MNLDLLVLGLLLFFALLGAAAGGLMQLSHVGAVVVGGLASRPLGVGLGPRVAAHFSLPPVVGVLGVTVLGFVVVYAVVQVLCRMALRRVLQSRALGQADRALGFALGAGKTAMILFVLLSAFVFFEKPIAQLSPALHFDTRGSQVAEFVRGHNLFTNFSFPGVKGLTTLARAGTDPAAAARLAESPEFAELTRDPRVQLILKDGSLQHSLQSGDYVSMLKSNKVLEALTDPKLQGELANLGSVTLPNAVPKARKN